MRTRRFRGLAKQFAVSAASAASVYPVPATSRSEVAALVRSLRPRLADRELIRLGPAGDGGYLVPDDLDGIEACYSPGVGGIIGFETDCAARGMQVFMADGSVESPLTSQPRLHFEQRFVGALDDARCMTLDTWVARTLPGSTGDLMLQIDIEGAEYETLLSVSPGLLGRFRIIAAEFHDIDQWWNRPYFRIVSRAFARLLATHHCVHAHPNNCTPVVQRDGIQLPPVMEFTFWRRDRGDCARFARRFPHPLDVENTDEAPLPLPAHWYKDE
jgi:hypothetical protein